MPVLLVFLLLSCGNNSTFSDKLGKFKNIKGKVYKEKFKPEARDIDDLDILLVIDGSESMQEERELLATKLMPLLSKVRKSDWQIAITSTNSADDCLQALITAHTPDYEKNIYTTAINSVSSGSFEEAVKMAIRSLRGLPVKKDGECAYDDNSSHSWLRPKSALAVLLVTDEDHKCHQVVKNEECSLEDLHAYLNVQRVVGLTARVYGLLNQNKNKKFLAYRDADGESIFARQESITNADYTELLESISQDLSFVLQYTYSLEKKFNGEASEVIITYGNDEKRTLKKNEYSIKKDKLIIVSNIPRDTSLISVSYSYFPVK